MGQDRVRRSDSAIPFSTNYPLQYVHSDTHAAVIRDIVLQRAGPGPQHCLPATWLQHVNNITQTNVWRPLPLFLEKVTHLVNKGSNLSGALAFSLPSDCLVHHESTAYPYVFLGLHHKLTLNRKYMPNEQIFVHVHEQHMDQALIFHTGRANDKTFPHAAVKIEGALPRASEEMRFLVRWK
jgi:hypothetical protein